MPTTQEAHEGPYNYSNIALHQRTSGPITTAIQLYIREYLQHKRPMEAL